MGASGDIIGRKTKSIIPDYEIRYRKQGGRPWYVYEKGEQKMAFSCGSEEECKNWLDCRADLFRLAASHAWGRK
jgi:hypothetical protein